MGDHLFEVDGVHVSRLEDLRLITGAGTYASDWNLPGCGIGISTVIENTGAGMYPKDEIAAKMWGVVSAARATQPR